MLRALSHAIVHVVALGRYDPVLPLYVAELNVEVFLAAHAHVITAPQRALAQGVLVGVVAQLHLRHQERLVGRVAGRLAATQVESAVFAVHLQTETPLTAVQEGLQGGGDRERVPSAPRHVHAPLKQQRAIGAARPRQVDFGVRAAALMRGVGRTHVQPQRRLQHLHAVTFLLQELERQAAVDAARNLVIWREIRQKCLLYNVEVRYFLRMCETSNS